MCWTAGQMLTVKRGIIVSFSEVGAGGCSDPLNHVHLYQNIFKVELESVKNPLKREEPFSVSEI